MHPLDFYHATFPALDGTETIHIRAFDRDTGVIVNEWCDTPQQATEMATYLSSSGNTDVYFGVNARTPHTRDKAGVTKIRLLHADMDFKLFHNSREEAQATLDGFELPPSYVVDSGGGYHLYWVLAEPLEFTPANVAYVESLMERLYHRLGGLDKVQDVSRILRCPGTVNHKYEWHPVADVVEELGTGVKFTLDDFEAVLPQLPIKPVVANPTSENYVTPTEVDVASMLAVLPKEGWDYRDYVAILMAVHSVLPDERGIRLVQEWSPVLDADGNDITAEKFASFRSGGISIGTLVHHATDHGWIPPRKGPRLLITRDGMPRLPKGESRIYVKEWEVMAATTPPVTVDELPYMLRVWHEYLYPATKNFPVEWTTMMTLAFWSTQWQRILFENLHLNLWFLGIGPQSGGKSIGQSEARDCIRQLMQRREMELALFSSGTTRGLMNGMKGEEKSLLAVFDEFSGFMKAANTEYTAGIKEALCSLYDGGIFVHRKAEEEVSVDNPYMTLSGITTPSFFVSAAKRDDMANGFMSRFLFCAVDALRDTPEVRWDSEKRAALVETMFNHVIRFAHITKARFDTNFGQVPECYRDYLKSIGMNTGQVVKLEDELRQPETIAWGRVAARIKKVATLLALAGENPKIVGDTIYVHESDVALAIRICNRSAAYQKRAMEWLSHTPDEANLEKVVNVMSTRNGVATERELIQFCHLKKQAVRDALSVLVGDGAVESREEARTTRFYLRESRV